MADTLDPKNTLINTYKESNSIQYFAHSKDLGCWVRNKTKNASNNKPMTVVFEVGNTPIILPATVAPIDLCKYAQKEDLIKSHGLITALNLRTLEIMTEADALKLLEEPAMKIEVKRLQDEANVLKNINAIDSQEENIPNAAMLNKAIAAASIDVIEAIDLIKDKGLEAAVERLNQLKLYFTDNDVLFVKEKLSTVEGGMEAINQLFG